ncbi:MAG: HAD family hydrolase [Bacteroidia bacterium]
MINLSIPGFKESISINHLVLDFNGTLAVDGKLINGLREVLTALSEKVHVHVLTGDTFGTARKELENIPCEITLLAKENQGAQKEKYIQQLGPETIISIGNGHNDRFMLKESAIGIIVIQKEGASVEALMAADVVCSDILSALDLINNPLRLKATLRD